ncbi:ATP-binding protein [Streptomyces aurantiacus]|uniref:ATP-binding protein n=1 Tax=Streptomyces aurantiacus TaxID=47760 RepID=A0A7G1NXW3_9ACTN|nr:ATP-binding protein [Streptomyces aurantiacus]BCL25755.1 ATP-binding protein [Streptomyces aurantiacus]
MESLIKGGGRMAPQSGRIETTVALEGDSLCIAEARHLAADFLSRAQAEHGLPVTDRMTGLTQLVVSELVTNALKYAPGPVLIDLRIADGALEVAVWDSDPVLPVARSADPGRVGQHGLEIVMAICETFEVRREPVGKHVTARIALLDDPGLDTR